MQLLQPSVDVFQYCFYFLIAMFSDILRKQEKIVIHFFFPCMKADIDNMQEV